MLKNSDLLFNLFIRLFPKSLCVLVCCYALPPPPAPSSRCLSHSQLFYHTQLAHKTGFTHNLLTHDLFTNNSLTHNNILTSLSGRRGAWRHRSSFCVALMGLSVGSGGALSSGLTPLSRGCWRGRHGTVRGKRSTW